MAGEVLSFGYCDSSRDDVDHSLSGSGLGGRIKVLREESGSNVRRG